MRFAIVAVLVLGLCALPAVAEKPEPPQAAVRVIDPAAVNEAIKMLDAGDFEQQILMSTDVAVEGMLAIQIERLQKEAEEPLPDDLIASFRKTLLDHARSTLKRRMPQIKRQSAEIYAREFTVEELRRLREISDDPVMVKSRAKGQALSAQLMMVGVQAMRDSEGELKRKIEQLVQDYVKKAGLETDDKS